MTGAAALLILALIPDQGGTPSTDAERCRVTLRMQNAPLAAILEQLRADTGIPIDLDRTSAEQLDFDCSMVSVVLEDVPLDAALRRIFQPRNFKVIILRKKALIVAP